MTMNHPTPSFSIATMGHSTLHALVRKAADQLAGATTAAEVLDARDMAGVAYDAAKSAGRFLKKKRAHDEVIAGVHQAQLDALEIGNMANKMLANEYEAAQSRGEVAKGSVRTDIVPDGNDIRPATAAEIGLSRKQIHEARQIRDVEAAHPGLIHRALAERMAEGKAPTKADVRRVISEALTSPKRTPRPDRSNPLHQPNPAMDSINEITQACRMIRDRLNTHGSQALMSALFNDGMRERTLDALADAQVAITELMGAINAEA